MMCLGWSTKSTCKAREDLTVPGTEPCSAMWFWLSAAAIAFMAVTKDNRAAPQG